MSLYSIHHITTYRYQYPVSISHHSAHLKPGEDHQQSCESFNLNINPTCVGLLERMDFFENTVHMFSIQETHDELSVESVSRVRVDRVAPKLKTFSSTWADIQAANDDYSAPAQIDSKPFLYHTETTPNLPEIEAFGKQFFQSDKPLGGSIEEMLEAFSTQFEFDNTATEVSTPIGQVFKKKRGVCQDFAHLMIAALRSCGIATRYVSGYILTQPPPGQERLQGADASHAWVSVYDPVNGWFDVDPTNNIVCGDQHVRVAYGRDYTDVVMLGGAVTGGGTQKVSVEVTMQPLEDY